MKALIAYILLVTAFSFHAFAGPVGQSKDSTTAQSVSTGEYNNGLVFTVFGDPGVNVFGLNYLHSLNDDWRFRGGFGTMFDFGWSIGAGFDYRVPTGSHFRPVAGLDLNLANVNDTELSVTNDSSSFMGVDFTTKSTTYHLLYSTLKIGVEFQAASGFITGLTMQALCGRLIANESTTACAIDPYPALRIGSMF